MVKGNVNRCQTQLGLKVLPAGGGGGAAIVGLWDGGYDVWEIITKITLQNQDSCFTLSCMLSTAPPRFSMLTTHPCFKMV